MSVEDVKKRLANKNAKNPPPQEEALKMDSNAKFSITLEDLTALCQANPDHPNAKAWAGLKDVAQPGSNIFVDRVDLEALTDNKEVVVTTNVVEGVTRKTKSLGKSLGASKPEPKPEPKPGPK